MKSLFDYISRIGKSKGFGIQSPWAYDFVKDVIMEELPYYSYEDIDRVYAGEKERRMQKLYFRVWNFVHNNNFSIMNLENCSIDDIKNIALSNGEEGCILLENIYNAKDIAQKWELLKDSDYIGITFDLYDVAICFMPNSMYKQHYKLNF